MKKLICLAVSFILLTACAQTKNSYYTASEGCVGAYVDLHCSDDYSERLDSVLEGYGVNFTIDDIAVSGVENEFRGFTFLIIPENEDVTVNITGYDGTVTRYNCPILVFDADYYGDSISLTADGETYPVKLNGTGGAKVEELTDKLLYDENLFEDETAFTEKAYEMGYSQSQLDAVKTGHFTTPDDYRLFVLSYGESRMNREGHDCDKSLQVTSPDGRYTIRYPLLSWGGEGSYCIYFLTNNVFGGTTVLSEEYWGNKNNTPCFTGNTGFAVFDGNKVAFFDGDNPLTAKKEYTFGDSGEDYRVTDVYFNERDNTVIISWCHIPAENDYFDKATYNYKFVIADTDGNILKELDSNLPAAWTVAGIAAPDFTVYDGQHPDGALSFSLWKYGSFTLDLETGIATEIQ